MLCSCCRLVASKLSSCCLHVVLVLSSCCLLVSFLLSSCCHCVIFMCSLRYLLVVFLLFSFCLCVVMVLSLHCLSIGHSKKYTRHHPNHPWSLVITVCRPIAMLGAVCVAGLQMLTEVSDWGKHTFTTYFSPSKEVHSNQIQTWLSRELFCMTKSNLLRNTPPPLPL